jgi:hypothetical protein
MDTGSRSIEVIRAVPWRRATLVWMLIMLAETVHGVVREIFIAPVLGDLRARQLGVLVGAALIFLIAWATARWVSAAAGVPRLIVGIYWVLLTLAFEIALGRAIGLGWSRILEDYDLTRGGFMSLGLVFMACAPALAARLCRSRMGRLRMGRS